MEFEWKEEKWGSNTRTWTLRLLKVSRICLVSIGIITGRGDQEPEECDQRTPVDVKLQETPRKDEQGDEMNHNESIPSTNNNMRRICGIHRERRDPPLCVETIRRCLSNDHLKLHSLSKQTTLRINMQIRASTTHTFIHSREVTCNTTHTQWGLFTLKHAHPDAHTSWRDKGEGNIPTKHIT